MSLVVLLLLYFASDITKESFSSVTGDNVLIDKPGGFQGDASRLALSSSGYTSLHSGEKDSFPRMGESDHSVRSDPLQSGAFGNSSSGGYPSLYCDKPGAFQGLPPAESKNTPLQKGNT